MNPIYDFKGQVALVTGAAKGMGLATARMFAESGASVVLADIDGDLATKDAERIVLEGGTAIGIACDVADEAQVAAMVDRAVAEYGRLDMAFNNAGIQVPPSDAADELIENFERVTAVNQRGVWACMKHELRVMSRSRQRRDRQLFVLGRSRRPAATCSLSRHQARRARNDQKRGCRICAARHPHQRGLPRHDRHPDGRRHARRSG
jgi:NAD(P)-dependent dehydrogenase (short-subunit alcohol dehydrogenase family)